MTKLANTKSPLFQSKKDVSKMEIFIHDEIYLIVRFRASRGL